MATQEQEQRVDRRFIYAMDMHGLRDRIEQVRRSTEAELDKAEELVEQWGEAEDWKARFEYLAMNVQDFLSGIRAKDELQFALRKTYQGVEMDLNAELRARWGPSSAGVSR
jgi:hypothetical protein